MPIEQRVVGAPVRPGVRPSAAGAPKPATAAEPDETPSRRKPVLLILAIVAALLLAAASYVLVLAPGDGEPGVEPPPEAGAVFTVEPMSINLADNHYLRLGLGLQLTKGAGEIDSAKARDAAIALFSGRSVAEIADAATRESLKTDLTAVLSDLYDGEVMGVYLTDYVTQ